MPEAVIVAVARTPIGRAFKGIFAAERPDDLAAAAVRAALEKVPELPVSEIDDLILGCGTPGGLQGHNLGRIVAVQLGLDALPGHTVSRYCASSVQSLRSAMHAIRAGEGDAYIAAGVESISSMAIRDPDQAPGTKNPAFDEARARTERNTRETGPWRDPRLSGRLPDIYIPMGQTAENLATLKDVSRREQDLFALRSQQLAAAAIASGFWAEQISPYTLRDGKVVDSDESPRPGTNLDRLAALAPVFRAGGSVTAGNSCPLNDGAAAAIVMSDTRARQLGIEPLARIVATAATGLSPEIMGYGPVEATRKVLKLAGMTLADIDQFEINEAFAAQVIPSYSELGIDIDRLNINGGSIALGHPYGMTGVRIASTLISSLQRRDEQFGLETMCVGGGQGMAMILERLS